MNYLIENWYLIFGALILLVVLAMGAINIIKTPTNLQLEKVREWLLYACLLAEQELQSGTGQLKLRMVYDNFLIRFKWLSAIISFEVFSGLVDEALEKMNKMLQENKDVRRLIEDADTSKKK